MPLHIINRTDEIPTENWVEILQLAASLDFSRAQIVPPFQLWFQAVLAFTWLYGKRINENLSLHRKNVSFTQTEIKTKFFVGKKRSRKTPLELQPYQKTRNVNHKAVPYIQEYLREYDVELQLNLEMKKELKLNDYYLFPAPTNPRIRTVYTSFINAKGEKEVREYTYTDPGGYIYEENARYWLNEVNKQLPPDRRLYFHYGRHNIGIKMAYQGKTPYQIASVLDTTINSAIAYTKHAGGYSQEWTTETE